MIVNDAGQLLEVNPAACKLFGLASTELVGRTVGDFGVDNVPFPDLPTSPETSTSHLTEDYVRRADGSSCFIDRSFFYPMAPCYFSIKPIAAIWNDRLII